VEDGYFTSGDLRMHGRKARLTEELMVHPPQSIDVLLLEGSTLEDSRIMNHFQVN